MSLFFHGLVSTGVNITAQYHGLGEFRQGRGEEGMLFHGLGLQDQQ